MFSSKDSKLVILFLALTASALHARVFFAGSNPHITIFAFPQDIFLIPGEYAYFYTSYQNLPWWGDVDDPENKPNQSYLSTGEKIYKNGSRFEHNSAIHAIENSIGIGYTLSETMKTRHDFTYTALPMRATAQGTVGPAGSKVSFNYKEHNSIQDFYLRSLLAVKWGAVPVGFKVGLGTKFNTKPDQEMTVRGSDAQRLFWGWSSLQGAEYIANDEDVHARARTQDEYKVGALHRFDLQSAVTIPAHKIGTRFRYEFGELDQYNWQSSGGSDLYGTYNKSSMVKKVRAATIRPYANFTWYERDKLRFNTLALMRYTSIDSTDVKSGNNAINGNEESARTFVFQVNPNVNIYPWQRKSTYIDAAILCNYSHTAFDHKRNSGEYVSTNPYLGPDYTWSNFSYAKQNFAEVAMDIYSVFPLYDSADQTMAVGLSLLLWTRFKWYDKYYGNNSDDPIGKFTETGVRNNFDRETWLNSVINIIYRRGKYNYRLDIGQPLIYAMKPRTRVYDHRDGSSYKESAENMWVSQGGVKIGLFVATSLDNLRNMGLFPGKRENEVSD